MLCPQPWENQSLHFGYAHECGDFYPHAGYLGETAYRARRQSTRAMPTQARFTPEAIAQIQDAFARGKAAHEGVMTAIQIRREANRAKR